MEIVTKCPEAKQIFFSVQVQFIKDEDFYLKMSMFISTIMVVKFPEEKPCLAEKDSIIYKLYQWAHFSLKIAKPTAKKKCTLS